jgi:hypothetical protein
MDIVSMVDFGRQSIFKEASVIHYDIDEMHTTGSGPFLAALCTEPMLPVIAAEDKRMRLLNIFMDKTSKRPISGRRPANSAVGPGWLRQAEHSQITKAIAGMICKI